MDISQSLELIFARLGLNRTGVTGSLKTYRGGTLNF